MAGVGEASAIFALITGSIDLIKLSYEIYKAAQGKAPSRIRAVARELPSIVQLLEDADVNAKAASDDSIWNKVKPDLERCKEECGALHTLFESACPANASNPAQRMWMTSVAIVKGKRSEAEGHLAAILKILSVLETHHVITNTRLLEEVRETLEEWEENDAGVVHRGTGHNNVHTGSGTYHNTVNSGNVNTGSGAYHNIQAGQYNENNTFYQNDNAALREERAIEELLAWLNYPGMDQRHEEVEKAHKDTFQWIFDCHQTDPEDPTESWHLVTSDSTQPQNTSFVSWLREETGIFWINGKPGAGKSTLMKCIMGDPRLEEHAKFWAGSHELSISSFYFWKLGSKIQKSLCGLYRALLWQILNDDRTLARKAFPGWQANLDTTESGPKALRAAFDRLMKACVLRKKYLVLIDGLDEYEDDGCDTPRISEEIISRDILRMVESGSVKVIIASRPHRVFNSYFSHGRKLAVHSLTARDLELFAQDRLLNDATIRPSGENLSATERAQLRRLVLEIVRRSCGVFLWARVVVDLARVHIRDYHDLDQLEGILAKLHPDIEELFDQIMDMILRLRGPEKIEGLRYLALVSHWFATFSRSYRQYSNWLPISILSVGCELSIEKVTEPWLQGNAQRLKAIGHHELRASGRIESYCFGLLEVSTIEEGAGGAFEPNPTRKVIKPLHRTLMEYLSRHYAIQGAQELSLPGHEPYDTNTAVLLGLVVMGDHIYPLVPRMDIRRTVSSPTPGLMDKVLIYNKLAEESTGVAQIALMSAFDCTMKAGFAAIVKRHCHLDHDHMVHCLQPSDRRHLSEDDLEHLRVFDNLVRKFALNLDHPWIPNPEGFLDLLAITIACDSNALLMRWISTTISQSRAIVSAEAARLLDHALNKRYVLGVDETVREPNLGALQSLLQIEASPDIRLDGVSAWERFLDQMLSQTMESAENFRRYKGLGLRWDLKALHILLSYGVSKDVYRTWLVVLEEPGESSRATSVHQTPGKRWVIEFRRYSVVQIVRQTASVLHRHYSAWQPAGFPHQNRIDLEDCFAKITELEQLIHHLEEQNANTVPGPRCSWSDLRMAEKDRVLLESSSDAESKLSEALVTARRTGCDISEYQQIHMKAPLPSDEGSIAEWLPLGCRETHELLKDLVPNETQQWLDRLTLEEGEQQAGFDVVGWLVFEEDDHYYEADSSSSESSSDDLPA